MAISTLSWSAIVRLGKSVVCAELRARGIQHCAEGNYFSLCALLYAEQPVELVSAGLEEVVPVEGSNTIVRFFVDGRGESISDDTMFQLDYIGAYMNWFADMCIKKLRG